MKPIITTLLLGIVLICSSQVRNEAFSDSIRISEAVKRFEEKRKATDSALQRQAELIKKGEALSLQQESDPPSEVHILDWAVWLLCCLIIVALLRKDKDCDIFIYCLFLGLFTGLYTGLFSIYNWVDIWDELMRLKITL